MKHPTLPCADRNVGAYPADQGHKVTQETRTMFPWRAAIAAMTAAGALWVPAAAWAQNAIQSITSDQQSGTEVVRIELAEALTVVPNGFVVQTPPRIAIDLPGVTNALGRNSVEVNQGNLRSVSVAQSLASSRRPSAVRTSTRGIEASPTSSATAWPSGVDTTNSSRGGACVQPKVMATASRPRRAESRPSMANGASTTNETVVGGTDGMLAQPVTMSANTAAGNH